MDSRKRVQQILNIQMMIDNADKINSSIRFPYKLGAKIGQGIDTRGNLYTIAIKSPIINHIAKKVFLEGKQNLQMRYSSNNDSLEKSRETFTKLDKFSYIFTAHGHANMQKVQKQRSQISTAHIFHYKDHFAYILDYKNKSQEQTFFKKEAIGLLQNQEPQQFFNIFGSHIIVEIHHAFSFYGKVDVSLKSSVLQKNRDVQTGTGDQNGKKTQQQRKQTQQFLQKMIGKVFDTTQNITGVPVLQGSAKNKRQKDKLKQNYIIEYNCKTTGVNIPILRVIKQIDLWSAYILYLDAFNKKTYGKSPIPQSLVDKLKINYLEDLILKGISQQQIALKKSQENKSKKIAPIVGSINYLQQNDDNNPKAKTQTNITQIIKQQLPEKISQFNKNQYNQLNYNSKIQTSPVSFGQPSSSYQQIHEDQDKIPKIIKVFDNAQPYFMIAVPWMQFLNGLYIGIQSQPQQQKQKKDKIKQTNQSLIRKQNTKQLQKYFKKISLLSVHQITQVKKQIYEKIIIAMNLSDYQMAANIIAISFNMNDFTHNIICHYQSRKQFFRLTQLYEALSKLSIQKAKNFAKDNLYFYRKLNCFQRLIRTVFCCCYNWEDQYFQTIRFSYRDYDIHQKKVHYHNQLIKNQEKQLNMQRQQNRAKLCNQQKALKNRLKIMDNQDPIQSHRGLNNNNFYSFQEYYK